jgi:sulfatase modifying factor 1
MVVVPAGSFVMGTAPDDADRWDDVRESPAHPVTIARAFALARYEVTRAQFAAFAREASVDATGCNAWSGKAWVRHEARSWRDPGFPQRDDEPVVCVSWEDARAFAAWLSRRTGASYRLPTEAEWEYAARAGTTTSRYWGNASADGCAYANIGDRSLRSIGVTEGLSDCDDGHVHTAPVGAYRPNAFGLYDMLGNAWEWTAACWQPGYAAAARPDCAVRVPRGASWNSHYRNVRSANRGSYEAAGRYYHIGIRVARDL